MAQHDEIEVEIHFRESSIFPAAIVSTVIERVDHWIYQSDIEDFETFLKEAKVIPQTALDATRYRIERYPKTALHFRSARSGSFVLVGVAATVSLWILQQTLGDTLKEAWRGSNLHKGLKEFLTSRRRERAERIADKIRSDKTVLWPTQNGRVAMETKVDERERVTVILVFVYFNREAAAPTRGDLRELVE